MRIILLLSIITFSLGLQAQNKQGSERVRAAKIEFFTEKLDLTPTESDKFWPIYNDYQSRKSKLKHERLNIMRFYEENNLNMSPQELNESLNRFIEIEKELAILIEKYNDKFKQVLANDKVLKIYVAEIQFRDYLLKQLRTNQKGVKPRN